MTPDNIIGTLSNMQEVQTDLNFDLMDRRDSLKDKEVRRGRANNRNRSKSRSKSPMAKAKIDPDFNPYEFKMDKKSKQKAHQMGYDGFIDFEE